MGTISLVSGNGGGMGGRKGLLNEWEDEADLKAGSETIFMIHLGGLMGCGQRGGKVAGWVRVKSCLLKGSCHQPP